MGIKYIGGDLRFEVVDLADNTSDIIATSSSDIGHYKIFDSENPVTLATFSWSGSNLMVEWIQGTLVSDQDESGKMCIYLDAGNVVVKNNLGSIKSFIVYKQI